MKFFGLIFFLTVQNAMASVDQAQVDASIKSAAAGFYTSMVQCPEKIWDNYTWKNNLVYFIRPSQSTSVLWDVQSGKVTNPSNTTLPPKYLTAGYSFNEENGRLILSLNVDDIFNWYPGANENQVLSLGVHEFFHFAGQRDWTRPSGPRGSRYPMKATPRIYRNMIYSHLREYFFSPQTKQESLGKAAYWYQKWSKEFSYEIESTTDGYEGSARYVEFMGEVIAKTGCGIDKITLLQKAQEHLATSVSWGFPIYGTLDGEGYPIGGLSGLILQLTTDISWQARVKAGDTPLQVLLEKVPAVPDVALPDVENSLNTATEKKNKELGEIVDAELANINKSEFVRVMTPGNTLTTNYSPIAFLIAEQYGNLDTTPMRTSLIFKGAHHYVTTAEKAVLFSTESPCGNNWFALVPRDQITEEKPQHFKIKSKMVNGDVTGKMKKVNGITWLCPN